MGTGLVIYENNQQVEISVDDLRKYVAPGLDEKEFWMFVQTAKTYGLNPIKREIYAVKYGNTFSVITGYQVYLQRLIAADIIEYWEVDIEKPKPDSVDTWIGVFKAKRKDWSKEFVWKVAMKEVNKKQALWNLQPEFQLKKVAISQGCRMLAPEIVGGMPYISDELGIEEGNQYEQKQTTNNHTEQPKESNGDHESLFLKAKSQIDANQTINELDKWQKTNAKKINESPNKRRIEDYIKQKRFDLIVETLSKVMNADQQIIADFIVIAKPEETVIKEAMVGDIDAMGELGKMIDNFKARQNEQADNETVDNVTELDLLADEKSKHNPPM